MQIKFLPPLRVTPWPGSVPSDSYAPGWALLVKLPTQALATPTSQWQNLHEGSSPWHASRPSEPIPKLVMAVPSIGTQWPTFKCHKMITSKSDPSLKPAPRCFRKTDIEYKFWTNCLVYTFCGLNYFSDIDTTDSIYDMNIISTIWKCISIRMIP